VLVWRTFRSVLLFGCICCVTLCVALVVGGKIFHSQGQRPVVFVLLRSPAQHKGSLRYDASGGGAAQLSKAEEARFRRDVVERPDADLAQFDRVSVADFGAAMLRGMNARSKGAARKRAPAPKDAVLRQKRLGLGAKPTMADAPPPSHGKAGGAQAAPAPAPAPVKPPPKKISGVVVMAASRDLGL
jgi:hypothetical protein